jgi:parallel beta-helix repeat protein
MPKGGLRGAVLGVVVLALTASPATAKQFEVDDDREQCRKADFTSIQAAVTAAGARSGKDQIQVCPGLYQEQVRIEGPAQDGLRLRAKKKTKLSRDVAADPSREAIIRFPGTAIPTNPKALVLVRNAEKVRVVGFRITGPYVFSGCALPQDRTYGVRVDGNGSLRLERNRITEIRNADPALRGCQNGIAVQVGRQAEGQVGRARIKHNLIDLYEKNGPTVDNAGSFAWISHNDIFGEGPTPIVAQNGIQVGRGAGAKVDHNVVADNDYLPPTNEASGLILFDYDKLEVGHNLVVRNDTGIYLDGQGAKVDHNTVRDGDADGIYAESTSAENRIEHNRMSDNAEHDCHDQSVGSRTAGTANFWEGNFGETQNRPGLCKDAAVTPPVFAPPPLPPLP